MKPELPKVEPGAPKGEILDSLEKAYQSAEANGADNAEKEPVKSTENLARVGSVGLEAGLKNFELTRDDNSAGSRDDNDDGDTDDTSVVDQTRSTVVGTKPTLSNIGTGKTPASAEDRDDIEKEWVNKAKKIVEQTKADPFLQERAVSRLQADYMKKRFNKDVKLPEGDK